MKTGFAGMLMVAVLMAAVGSVHAADKKAKGGVIGNSYGSQMDQISDTSIRITTRKKISGDLEEINTPGTSVYKAFDAIGNATVVRAAVEARALGYSALKVSGTRNLSQTNEKRSASSCPGGVCETDFTFAKGQYTTDVELAIEVTFNLVKDLPADPVGYIDVQAVLTQNGL